MTLVANRTRAMSCGIALQSAEREPSDSRARHVIVIQYWCRTSSSRRCPRRNRHTSCTTIAVDRFPIFSECRTVGHPFPYQFVRESLKILNVERSPRVPRNASRTSRTTKPVGWVRKSNRLPARQRRRRGFDDRSNRRTESSPPVTDGRAKCNTPSRRDECGSQKCGEPCEDRDERRPVTRRRFHIPKSVERCDVVDHSRTGASRV
jgi:hypothetical protein